MSVKKRKKKLKHHVGIYPSAMIKNTSHNNQLCHQLSVSYDTNVRQNIENGANSFSLLSKW